VVISSIEHFIFLRLVAITGFQHFVKGQRQKMLVTFANVRVKIASLLNTDVNKYR
jgi:hypothetical protein